MAHKCEANQANFSVDNCELLMAAYILAGLAMMLNIRLSYSSAPYALIRFKLPENLFSVFVRRMASALELWCLPSMLLGNIIDIGQKAVFDNKTDDFLKSTAGTSNSSPSDGLRALAKNLHDKANALYSAVHTANDQKAAKVLKAKVGNQNDEGKLRKLAADLYKKALTLETSFLSSTAKDDQDLKLKAGTSEDDGLRKLAKDLYEAAKALADTSPSDTQAAQQLANAVGKDESSEGIRQKLKELAVATNELSGPASEVKKAYEGESGSNGVKQKYAAVQVQASAYSGGDKPQKYQAVVTAMTAFTALYNADLKPPATELKDAVGDGGSEGKLQKTLQELGDHSGPDHELPGKATAVKTAYDGGSGVKPKFGLVKAQQSSYKAIASIKSLYDKVVTAMDAFDNVYKPEELLKEAVGTESTSGLAKELQQLVEGSGQLSGLATDVKEKYNDVKSKFQLVRDQASAYKQSSTIKSNEYNPVVSAWIDFNNIYNGVICGPKYYGIVWPSVITQWLNFLTYVILWIVYVAGGDQGHLTIFYFVIAISGVVFGINMTLIYSVDFNYIPVYLVGENTFPMVTSFMHYLSTLMFGNRRKWNSDFLIVNIDIWVAIIISFVAAALWTYAYLCTPKDGTDGQDKWWHIYAFGFFAKPKPYLVSPCLMVIVGMGLVYAIYPGIAPGMIVPFYLIDKIEMVLLIATAFPPIIIAILRRYKSQVGAIYTPACIWGPDEKGWGSNNYTNSGTGTPLDGSWWHAISTILIVLKISLAAIFIYSLHYGDSNISRSIVNQPKMSTVLSIMFYMCHECLLAMGFTGIVGGNNGGDLVLIPQYIGALFMIFLAFYSEGYIIEYKSHDHAQWPTEGMTPWNGFCFWVIVTCKIIYSISSRSSTRILFLNQFSDLK